VIVEYVAYRKGRRSTEGRGPIEEAAATRADNDFVWIRVDEPSAPEMERVGAEFGLHELAVEDAHNAHQRPKVEEYPDSLFAVVRTVQYAGMERAIDSGEMNVFIGRDYVITVRHGGDPSDLDDFRRRAEHRPDLLAHGPSAVLYVVLDEIIDDYEQVVQELGDEIDSVEALSFAEVAQDAVAEEEAQPRTLRSNRQNMQEVSHKIYRLHRLVIELRHVTAPLVLPLGQLERGEFAQVPTELTGYFRDVRDHLERSNDALEGFRDKLAGSLHANLARVNMRQNEIVQKISGWAAIIAVPTLITGIYGMNFEHMPELKWTFGYPLALTVIFGLAAGLYYFLRRINWL
jgi:magnesium transporter